ncbi:MAG: thioredoxin [Thermodesulfovibrionia bacterium]|nr:thioredoxin [Thermodesulfovibrionia bacterium]
MGDVINVTSSSFEKDVAQAAGLVVVDFWATWCGPCKIISPIVEELATEYVGKAAFGKINTDENPDLASRFNIRGIPTLMFFKNGKNIDQLVGAVPKATLAAKINSLL